MRNLFIKYYAVIMLCLFIFYNIVLNNLKVGGILYQIFMIIMIIVNLIVLILFRREIKYKVVVIIVYFFTFLFSKNALQCTFGFSNIIVLLITGFMENNFIKVLALLITLFFVLFSMPLLFIYLLVFGLGINEETERNDIYSDMHYYCENNYEVYSYSAGAMDGFHYSIGRYYEFLSINGIIYVSYNERNEVSENEYNNYLKHHKCRLVGEIYESK